jgi:hypothetical protein
MLYGRSDINEVTIAVTGHRHGRKKGQEGPFQIDCPECEPVLLAQEGAFWAASLEDAPPTEGEVKGRERAREQMLLGQVSEFDEFRAWQRSQRAGTTV